MQRFVYKGKRTACLCITVLVFALFVTPHTQEGDTVFAFNLHNLGRVFERMVQLPDDQSEPFGTIGNEDMGSTLRVF